MGIEGGPEPRFSLDILGRNLAKARECIVSTGADGPCEHRAAQATARSSRSARRPGRRAERDRLRSLPLIREARGEAHRC